MLLSSLRSGVYYTQSSLKSDCSADLSLKLKTLQRLAKKSNKDLMSYFSENKILAVDQTDISLAKEKLIFVTNLGTKLLLVGLRAS